MDATYELFDHTADMGIRVRAPTREALIPAAVEGLYAVIGRLVPAGDSQPFGWGRKGDSPALLLREFLADALLFFESDHRLIVGPTVRRFTESHLSVMGRTCSIDEGRSFLDREVKAITYHELTLEPATEGWQATIIVDL